VRRSEIESTLRSNELELDNLAQAVARAGENELIQVRVRRNRLWQLIRASLFERTLSPEEASSPPNKGLS